jgi:catechol 2,3-dioxygenase-like lactoylglutathione lyase family enzyme
MHVTGIIPQLRTQNLDSSIRFYIEKVGMELAFRYADFYAGIRAGTQMFHLKLVDTPDPSIAFVRDGDHLHLYFDTDDIEAFARYLQSRGVTLVRQPSDTEWQTRELVFLDDQGHTIYVGQKTGATAA